MRLPLATDLKTRTGAPDKDARLKNCYVESKGPANDPNNPPQTAVRKRPIAQGGIAVGTGTAQGGIGLNVNGVPYFFGFWSDVLYPYFSTGTTWNSGTSYNVGDMVSVNFVNYWAINSNTNNNPTSNPSNWSNSFVAPPPPKIYALFGNQVAWSISGLVATKLSSPLGSIATSNISKSSGKWYWECAITTIGNCLTLQVGIATSSVNLSDRLGVDNFGWSYEYWDYTPPTNFSAKFHNNTPATYGSNLATGDVIGVALDMDSGTLSFYKNGVSQGVAFTGLTGNIYAAIGAVPSTNPIIFTLNFGATPFVYSPPAGYNSGLYV